MGASRDSVLLGSAIVLPRVAGLLTVPIYTRLLGAEDFGRYELLGSIVALLYSGCLLGLDFAISVRYFRHTEPERRRDLASALGASAASSLVVVGLLAALAGIIGPAALQSSNGAVPLVIVLAGVPFNVLGGVLAMYLRLRFNGVAFFRAMVGGTVAGSLVGLVLVVVAQRGLVGAAIGLTAVHAITCLLLVAGVRGLLEPRSGDRRTAGQLVRIGAPLVVGGVAAWVFALSDRFLVAAYLGFTQLGLYAAAARLATVLALIQFGFHAAWGPLALRWGASADRDAFYRESLKLIAVGGGAAVAVVSWLAEPFLWLLVGPAYVSAANVVWLLSASVLFSALFFAVQIGSSLAQQGGRVASVTIVAAVVNTTANLMLIPRLGYVGAGVATLATYATAYGMMYVVSQRVAPIDMNFLNATGLAVGWTAIAGLSMLAPPTTRPFADIVVVGAAVVVGLRAVASAGRILARTPASGDAGEGRGNGTQST